MFFLRFGYFALLFLLIFFAFPPESRKKATHSDVSRLCGIIHGYARIRNPRLPRFLFGGESHMCKFLWDFFERLAVGFLLPAEVVTHSDSGFKRRGFAGKRHMIRQFAHDIPAVGDELTESHFDR